MRWLLVLLVALSACGTEIVECQDDAVIVHGICVNDPIDFPIELLEVIIPTLHEYEGLNHNEMVSAYRERKISFTVDAPQNRRRPENSDGAFFYVDFPSKRGSIIIAPRTEMYNSICSYQAYVIIHEMLHLAWWTDHGNADDDHRYIGLYRDDGHLRNTDDWIIYNDILEDRIRAICFEYNNP